MAHLVKQINYTGTNSLPGDLADGHVVMIVGSVTAAWASGRPGA